VVIISIISGEKAASEKSFISWSEGKRNFLLDELSLNRVAQRKPDGYWREDGGLFEKGGPP
jgi:hypothetical protein